MSRLGKKPVPVSDKVKISIAGPKVTTTGPLGTLSRTLPDGITAKVEGKDVVLSRRDDTPTQKALHGTWRKLVMNMLEGVEKGFSKDLRIEGVGFRATQTGTKISMTLGFSHIVDYTPPVGVKIVVDAKQTGLAISGSDKEVVGRVAAEIRRFKPPEPYKGTGIRYSDEHVRRKAGKAAAGAAGAGGKK